MAVKVDFLAGSKRSVNLGHIVSLTDNSGGTGSDTLADSNNVVTGVDGTANNAASKVDVDARLVTIANSIATLADKIEEIIVQLETSNISATS